MGINETCDKWVTTPSIGEYNSDRRLKSDNLQLTVVADRNVCKPSGEGYHIYHTRWKNIFVAILAEGPLYRAPIEVCMIFKYISDVNIPTLIIFSESVPVIFSAMDLPHIDCGMEYYLGCINVPGFHILLITVWLILWYISMRPVTSSISLQIPNLALHFMLGSVMPYCGFCVPSPLLGILLFLSVHGGWSYHFFILWLSVQILELYTTRRVVKWDD